MTPSNSVKVGAVIHLRLTDDDTGDHTFACGTPYRLMSAAVGPRHAKYVTCKRCLASLGRIGK